MLDQLPNSVHIVSEPRGRNSQCNPGAGSFRYDIGGSPNPYWFEFTVSNTR